MSANSVAKRAAVASACFDPIPVALEVFTSVPGWAIVHAAQDNRNAPLICQGEIAIVQSNGRAGWIPTEGGLFLIEYVSRPFAGERYERRVRDIVQTFKDRRGRWVAGGIRNGVVGGTIYCADGPYRDEAHLAEKLIGKVIGILSPNPIVGRA